MTSYEQYYIVEYLVRDYKTIKKIEFIDIEFNYLIIIIIVITTIIKTLSHILSIV